MHEIGIIFTLPGRMGLTHGGVCSPYARVAPAGSLWRGELSSLLSCIRNLLAGDHGCLRNLAALFELPEISVHCAVGATSDRTTLAKPEMLPLWCRSKGKLMSAMGSIVLKNSAGLRPTPRPKT